MIFLIVISMFCWSTFIMNYSNIDKCSVKELASIMKTIPIISGIQSRYFVPILPLLLVPIYNDKLTKIISKFNIFLYIIFYYFIIFIYLFIIILFRYWI